MTAPTWLLASTGSTDAGGAWTHLASGAGGMASGLITILHIVQDGSGAGQVTLDSMTASRRESLSGTANSLTSIGAFTVGGSSQAIQHLWIGRATSSLSCTFTGSNSGTDDIYIREYAFNDGITAALGGTSLATVIENATAGSTTNSTGTSNTASDASVQTLGSDRLALNFVGINDDNPFAGFTGQSGGTWTTRASYADATGTDGAMYLVDAAMASAGTIAGGTSSITDIDAWGVVGFALIGTTPAASGSLLIPHRHRSLIVR